MGRLLQASVLSGAVCVLGRWGPAWGAADTQFCVSTHLLPIAGKVWTAFSSLICMDIPRGSSFFFFNWRILSLQCCVGFCHTVMWISHRYTYVPSLLNLPPTSQPFPPLWVFTEDWFELPESYRRFPLAILWVVMYMFQCYSLNSSHPLLPPLCPQVCSLCLCLHCYPTNRFISTIFLDSIYIYALIYDICFSLSDLLHSV